MFLLLGLGLAVSVHADESLKSIFSADEYQRAGLDKLSPEEQAVLLRALHQRGVRKDISTSAATTPATIPATKPAIPPPEKKGLWVRIMDFGAEQLPLRSEKDPGEVTEVDAQLIEPFAGLSGKTLFRLDNGQVWQQRIGESYYIGKPIPNPKVILLRTRFGYRLKIPAVDPNFDVAIKRIQ